MKVRRWAALVTALAGGAAGLTVPGAVSAGAGSFQWYKADLHVHSAFSADAYPDLGIISQSAKAAGFNAIFLTDHNLASNFPISAMTANNVFLPDAPAGTTPPRRWTAGTSGSNSSSTDAVVTSPVASSSSTSSVHLASTSSTAGESFIWTKRGPLLRSSDAMLSFSVNVSQLTGNSGVYVSTAIGGDPTIKSPSNNPVGYTTAAGVISPGKSYVLDWYFGAPPPASFYSKSSVVSHALGTSQCDKAFALSTWITCTVDLTAAAKSDIPTADQPLDYDAFTDLKMSAAGNAGTANAYFDNYSVQSTSDSAEEFVYRNSIIDSHPYDTSTFTIFPSLEMGVNEHAQRFNFDITNTSQFVSYSNGIDGIGPTQNTGYAAQLNHPGVPGGVSDSAAVSTNAEGADLMEVRQSNMITDWDAILRKGIPLVGTWGGDNHIGHWTTGSQSTEIWADSLTFDSLMSSLKQGRDFLSAGVSGLAFNLDGSTAPYPAATPDVVPTTQTSQPVYLTVAGGVKSGDTVRWLSNEGSTTTTSVLATDTISSTSYSAVKNVPLNGAPTYVRAEVYRGSTLRGMTEAIMFVPSSSTSGDTTPPSPPTGLTATPASSSEIDLSWNAASDNVGVTGYRIYRNGVETTPYATVTGTTFADTGLAAGTTYSYEVSAIDAAGNESTKDGPVQAATDAAGTTVTTTLVPAADAYVNSANPSTNYGGSTALRVDNSPDVHSFVRFDLTGITGTVLSAQLRVYANSSQSAGYRAVNLVNPADGWGERTITYSTAPALGSTVFGSSGAAVSGSWAVADVTSFVQSGEGSLVSLALNTTSGTALSLASRESANPPQLVITTSA